VSKGSDVIMAVSADEQMFAQGSRKGQVLVWNFPTGKFAGLIANTDWDLEGALSTADARAPPDPPRTGINADRGVGEYLEAIGFDESNRLIGVSRSYSRNNLKAWVWRAKMGKLALDSKSSK
jgi:hypothetical protein